MEDHKNKLRDIKSKVIGERPVKYHIVQNFDGGKSDEF